MKTKVRIAQIKEIPIPAFRRVNIYIKLMLEILYKVNLNCMRCVYITLRDGSKRKYGSSILKIFFASFPVGRSRVVKIMPFNITLVSKQSFREGQSCKYPEDQFNLPYFSNTYSSTVVKKSRFDNYTDLIKSL